MMGCCVVNPMRPAFRCVGDIGFGAAGLIRCSEAIRGVTGSLGVAAGAG
jgi:hypothetical protein